MSIVDSTMNNRIQGVSQCQDTEQDVATFGSNNVQQLFEMEELAHTTSINMPLDTVACVAETVNTTNDTDSLYARLCRVAKFLKGVYRPLQEEVMHLGGGTTINMKENRNANIRKIQSLIDSNQSASLYYTIMEKSMRLQKCQDYMLTIGVGLLTFFGFFSIYDFIMNIVLPAVGH